MGEFDQLQSAAKYIESGLEKNNDRWIEVGLNMYLDYFLTNAEDEVSNISGLQVLEYNRSSNDVLDSLMEKSLLGFSLGLVLYGFYLMLSAWGAI